MNDFTFPQQAKTNHPDVIAAIEETLRREAEFRVKARAISEKYTGDPLKGWLNGRTFEGQHLSQIQVTEEQYKNLPGRWKQRDHMGRTAPYKNNPVCEEFHVGFRAENIPGRGNILWGSGYMGTGTVFLHHGYVYSHLGFKPQIGEKAHSEIAEYGWTEILASELHLALEAYNANLKEKP
ncbi:hypothetical protein [Glutamicibacter creatinolyticus]|uniref:hypothetical protein n=1 Tax=Glutamicibacter creatinolyticus TaxID=162496 RepID=UPI0031D085FB